MASFSPEEIELIKSRGNDVGSPCLIILNVIYINILAESWHREIR